MSLFVVMNTPISRLHNRFPSCIDTPKKKLCGPADPKINLKIGNKLIGVESEGNVPNVRHSSPWPK